MGTLLSDFPKERVRERIVLTTPRERATVASERILDAKEVVGVEQIEKPQKRRKRHYSLWLLFSKVGYRL